MASPKVSYVPSSNPHPQAGDAPRTGVPTNPAPAKVETKQSAKEHMANG